MDHRRTATAIVFGLAALALPQLGHGGDWPPEMDCACTFQQVVVDDPMLSAIDEHYPAVIAAIREKVVADNNMGPTREIYEWTIRPRVARLIDDITPVASVDNTWRLIELQRDEALTAQPFRAQACAEVLSRTGLVGFAAAMITLDQYQAREDALIIDLVVQTDEHPAAPPAPLSTAEKAAFHQAVLDRLPPEMRAPADEALRQPDAVATMPPYADAFCRYGLAERDALLAMPRDDAARVYKGLRS